MKFASPLACNCGKPHIKTISVFNARRNPLRKDPTRTTMIQLRFMRDVNRRFKKLRDAIYEFLVTLDALGLSENTITITSTTKLFSNATFRQYAFQTDSNKLSAFSSWLQEQIDANVLSIPPGADPTKPWTFPYIDSAYKRGTLNAYLSAKQPELFGRSIGDESQDEFMRSSFLQPETVSKVQLLATRSFEGMKGLSSQMRSNMNRVLAQAIADGKGARDIARQLFNQVGVSRKRALMIARTEIIHTHAEGQLDSFERLGVKDLGVMAEWSTAGDESVCPRCAALEGKVYTIDEARGKIPLHPNCRCTWIPSV